MRSYSSPFPFHLIKKINKICVGERIQLKENLNKSRDLPPRMCLGFLFLVHFNEKVVAYSSSHYFTFSMDEIKNYLIPFFTQGHGL